MVLRPAVLDQVPHVVELAGVAPAPGWRLPDDNQNKYTVTPHSCWKDSHSSGCSINGMRVQQNRFFFLKLNKQILGFV